MPSHYDFMQMGGRHRGLPLQRRRCVGATLCGCPLRAGLRMSKIHRVGTYTNRASKVYYLPPSCRFPPLREGNQAARPLGSPCVQGGTLRRGFSFIRTFVNSGSAIGKCLCVGFSTAPLPTSPVDGGGAATPSPPAGRVGVGAMFKSHCKDTYWLTDLPARAVCGSWSGSRLWMEQGFRWQGAWVFWVALVSCGFCGGYGLGVVGVCVGVFVGGA